MLEVLIVVLGDGQDGVKWEFQLYSSTVVSNGFVVFTLLKPLLMLCLEMMKVFLKPTFLV